MRCGLWNSPLIEERCSVTLVIVAFGLTFSNGFVSLFGAMRVCVHFVARLMSHPEQRVRIVTRQCSGSIELFSKSLALHCRSDLSRKQSSLNHHRRPQVRLIKKRVKRNVSSSFSHIRVLMMQNELQAKKIQLLSRQLKPLAQV